jgi:RNA polymerase sigma-70 factor (ECF subfamily)
MAGADDVVAELAATRWRALVGYAFLLTGSVADAEEVVQEALVKVVVRSRAGTDLHAAEAYARQAVLTVFLDRARRGTRWAALQHLFRREAARDVPDPAAASVLTLDVQAALAALSPRERACVVLRHVEDLGVAEVADRLGLSPGAVKRYTSDAVRRLEALLGPLDDARETTTVERTVGA